MKYEPKVEPWAHQKEALARMKGQPSFALLMAMRTGKTKVFLDDFGRMEAAGVMDDFLVIAPASVYHTWRRAIDDHVGDSLRERLSVFVWQAGQGVVAERELELFLQPRKGAARALIVNVEALSSVERARKLILKFATQKRALLVGVDESTTIKSPTAQRAKFVAEKLASFAKARRILTGLVAPRSPLDLFQQFYFLDWRILGYQNFVTFRSRYAIIEKKDFGGRWPAPIIKGYQNIDELYEKIESYSYRCRLEDCYQVPKSMWKFRDVEMTEEQKMFYSGFKHKASIEIKRGAFVTADIVIKQILRLRQILLGHVIDDEGMTHEIHSNRIKELLALLEEHEGKAIIWCSYDNDIRVISERLKKDYGEEAVARFWGGNKSTREEEERRFQNDPNCFFMVATDSAGGRGRKWAVADLAIYYSYTNNLEFNSQSEERPKAVGKEVPILYIYLRVPGTVEDKIIEGLRKKIDLAAIINGDNWQEWLI